MCDRKYSISEIWRSIQGTLFPTWEEVLEAPLCESHQKVVEVIELIRLEEFLPNPLGWGRVGAPMHDRRKIACAFLAKAVMNLSTTQALRERLSVDRVLRRLCGWETRHQIPSESTFSRAFATFADTGLLDEIHQTVTKRFLGNAIVWHLSRDATAIDAREKPRPASVASPPPKADTPPAEASPAEAKPKRGRPPKGEEKPPPEPTRLERQRTQTLEAALAELPRHCDRGVKKNSQGFKETWIGYSFQVDVTEWGVPTAALTTSASLHDSQPAIPLHRLSRSRIGTIFYNLMDAAYDATAIRDEISEGQTVPIIDRNRRRGPKPPPMEPDRARHYDGRTASERFHSDLKDNHGGRTVRVRGAAKVHTHLMFGLLVIFAQALLAQALLQPILS